MIEHDDYFVEMMQAIIEPLIPAMREELAQQEANDDNRTEINQISWAEFSGNFN